VDRCIWQRRLGEFEEEPLVPRLKFYVKELKFKVQLYRYLCPTTRELNINFYTSELEFLHVGIPVLIRQNSTKRYKTI
jgi:hypothetical protein